MSSPLWLLVVFYATFLSTGERKEREEKRIGVYRHEALNCRKVKVRSEREIRSEHEKQMKNETKTDNDMGWTKAREVREIK